MCVTTAFSPSPGSRCFAERAGRPGSGRPLLRRASKKATGASGFQTFWRVIFPLTLPGVIGGSIIVFIPSLGNFVVPAVLGGAKTLMLGNLIEQQFLAARNWPFGAALAMLVMSIVLFLLFIYVRHETRRGDDALGIR